MLCRVRGENVGWLVCMQRKNVVDDWAGNKEIVPRFSQGSACRSCRGLHVVSEWCESVMHGGDGPSGAVTTRRHFDDRVVAIDEEESVSIFGGSPALQIGS